MPEGVLSRLLPCLDKDEDMGLGRGFESAGMAEMHSFDRPEITQNLVLSAEGTHDRPPGQERLARGRRWRGTAQEPGR